MQKIIPWLILVSALATPVFGAGVDFDKGVDLTDFISSAVRQAPVSPFLPAVDIPAEKLDSGKVCNINFKSPPLELRAGDKSAQASYRINERCEPELLSVKNSQDTDSPGTEGIRPIRAPVTLEREVTVSHQGQNGFHFKVINATAWTIDTNPPMILDYDTLPYSEQNEPTWKRDGVLILAKEKYPDWPKSAKTAAQASFTCGPNCKFNTTLAAHADIFSNGQIRPAATIVGNVQPGDYITIEVTTP